MCDGMVMLDKMKRADLHCTGRSGCWCFGLKKRLDEPFFGEECLSPSELLSTPSACFCEADKKYLLSLAGRKFVIDD